jgi:NAD+ synthase (glutamine-hydrolysing)
MKIALAQMKVVPGRPTINVANMLKNIKDAKKQGVELLIFPEMCVGGYLLGDKWTDENFCENLMSFNEILRLATEGIAIAYGNIFVDRKIDERINTGAKHLNKDGRLRKYNAIYVFQNQRPVERISESLILPNGVQPKMLLPNYRIFDDERYFFSLEDIAKDFNVQIEDIAQPFKLETKDGERIIGFELCEDLWCEDYRKNNAPQNINKILIENGAELIMNLSSSPWTYGKNKSRDKRVEFLSTESGEKFVPFFYVNCTGVQNNGKNIVTFDGGSTIYNKKGLPVLFAKAPYEEELIVIEEKELEKEILAREEKSKIEQKYWAIIAGIRALKEMWGADNYPPVIIGLSGGIDSALVAALYVKAYGAENILGINMPTQYNSTKTKNAAKYIADKLGIKYYVLPIEELVEVNNKLIQNADILGNGKNLSQLNLENIQAKIRGTSILSNIAAKYNGIFTNNGNKLETALGYATLYGDVGGERAPIADLTKIEVVEMAKFVNREIFREEIIPEVLLPNELWRFREDQIQPSAELKDNQVDPMKFVYHCALIDMFTDYKKKSVEEIMQAYLEGKLHNWLDYYLKDIVGKEIGLDLMKRWDVTNPIEFIKDLEWFEKTILRNVFKRVQAPPIIITSKSAYGYDIRESILPYEQTARHEELKQKILALKEYLPADKIYKKDSKMKVALFGGSFNPIHNGHLQVAEELIKKQIVEQVWLIPCGNHAFNKDLAEGKKRMEMISLAINANPKIKVVGVEMNEARKSYSSETIAWFKNNFPHEFFWVIGADNVKDLQKWHDLEYLKNNVNFIIIKRPGYQIEQTEIKVAKIIEMQNEVSSTKIRENVVEGKDLKGLVPEVVEKFIQKEGLYK